jgi:hypothetical protein
VKLSSFVNPRTWFARSSAPRSGDNTHRVTEYQNQRMLRARFDSQFTTDDNRRHWALADSMSIDASANWQVRRTLRMRSRYEYHNNSYFQGIARTIADYVIGTGPRLQMLTKSKPLNAKLEKLWSEWAWEVGYAQKLWMMRHSRIYNGESFCLMRTNPRIGHPVKLDLLEIEADQVSSPLFGMYPAQYPDQFFDGLVLDPWGNPLEYHILRQHPGAFGAFVILGYEFDRWPARYVLHDYKHLRPAQRRGIPEVVPALPLFAELRRYTQAVRAAAETAADFAAVLKTNQPPTDNSDQQGDRPEPMDVVNINSRTFTVLPDGYDLSQTRAEQPTTGFDQFTWSILREICRCMCVPAVFGGMDSEKTNMSSAYVISQPFIKSVQQDRTEYDRINDRTFDEFINEAVRIDELAFDDLPDELPHKWFWPNIQTHADPLKVAQATQTDLASGATSIPHIHAQRGEDWKAAQVAAAESYGVSVEQYQKLLLQKNFGLQTQAAPGQAPMELTPATPPFDPSSMEKEETEDEEVGDTR